MTAKLDLSQGETFKVSFVSKTGATGQAGSFGLVVVRDGVSYNLATPASFSEIGGGVYTVIGTLHEVGSYFLIADSQVIAHVNVFQTNTRNLLQSILDATAGSWRWDKVAGKLTVYGTGGQVVATYNVEDTVERTSRQKIS